MTQQLGAAPAQHRNKHRVDESVVACQQQGGSLSLIVAEELIRQGQPTVGGRLVKQVLGGDGTDGEGAYHRARGGDGGRQRAGQSLVRVYLFALFQEMRQSRVFHPDQEVSPVPEPPRFGQRADRARHL